MLEGIDIILIGKKRIIIGITPLREKILSCFGEMMKKIYELENQPAPDFGRDMLNVG